jgi:acetate kinase
MSDRDRLNEDRGDFLAAMYGQDDQDEGDAAQRPDLPKKETGILSMPALTNQLRALQKQVEEQDRRMKRLDDRLRRIELHSGRLTRSVNDLDSDLANKIDRRD